MARPPRTGSITISRPTPAATYRSEIGMPPAGGTLGCWIVLYGLSYSAASLAHALFPGLVLAAIAGFPLLLGAGLGIVVAALAISLAGRTPEIGSDTAIAVVITTLFGAGALLALSRASPPGIQGL